MWCGAADGPHWSAPSRTVDFFDVKGVVEGICAAVGVEADVAASRHGFLVAGRAAELRARGTRGAPRRRRQARARRSPKRAAFPVPKTCSWPSSISTRSTIAGAGVDRLVASLPRFPSIVRDISMLVDDTLPAATVRGTIRSSAPSTLVSIAEFDRYQGKGVPDGRVSLSLRLTFRAPDRTLTDDEVQAATNRIVEALRATHGAEQR